MPHRENSLVDQGRQWIGSPFIRQPNCRPRALSTRANSRKALSGFLGHLVLLMSRRYRFLRRILSRRRPTTGPRRSARSLPALRSARIRTRDACSMSALITATPCFPIPLKIADLTRATFSMVSSLSKCASANDIKMATSGLIWKLKGIIPLKQVCRDPIYWS